MRVLIAVTHLLGAGHLTRAAALARAFSSARHEVTLVSGGMPSSLIPRDGLSFVQLPPVKTIGTDFRTLLDEAGNPVDDAYLRLRREMLLKAYRNAETHLLITELFPFGRRVLADEFLSLLAEAKAAARKPLIACSIRDILVAPGKTEKVGEAHDRLAHYYDAVLVHGDPAIAPLEASWPVDRRLASLLHYTGYVDEGDAPETTGPRQGILVSGGSSPASLPLYRAALEAARQMQDKHWRILVGRGITEEDFDSLSVGAGDNVTVERARPDFRALLAGAEVSVSQAGYNTVVDLLRSGPRAVLVPFEAGNETEQRLRAERLKTLGRAELVPEIELSGMSLAQAVREALTHPETQPLTISLDGAMRSVGIAENLIQAPALQASIDWQPFEDALTRAADTNAPVSFWWRDDDAVAHTPQLDRLLRLSRQYGAGLALAAIPQSVEPSLEQRLQTEDHTVCLVHGFRHRNHAPEGEKKAEFGAHRSIDMLLADARESLSLATDKLGPKLLPVFVPPWNRISPELVGQLPGLGYRGLSTFRDRGAAFAAPGLHQVNTHIDPIDWHGTRSLVGTDDIVKRLSEAVTGRLDGNADNREPIGFLTHHLVHDEAIWAFCERLLNVLSRNNVQFMQARSVFDGSSGKAEAL